MNKVLVIGCGGVASVAIKKCCQVSEVFTDLCIASRTKANCDRLAAELEGKTATRITTAQVDADDVRQVIDLINRYKPDLVMNIALPYQDLTIMDACLACGVNYMDTANYEPEDTDDPQWRELLTLMADWGMTEEMTEKMKDNPEWAALDPLVQKLVQASGKYYLTGEFPPASLVNLKKLPSLVDGHIPEGG